MVVNRFTKFGYFVAMSHPFTAQKVAQLFMDYLYKFHGNPEFIVTDRDMVFTSLFQKEIFKKMGVKLHMSSTYHPQRDRQT